MVLIFLRKMFLLLEEYWFCMSIVFMCLNECNLNNTNPILSDCIITLTYLIYSLKVLNEFYKMRTF